LNEWTVKNNYSLILISDIVENISTKKVFTKLNLWWDYNNIWIKKGDKLKTAFTMLKGLFEPTVINIILVNKLINYFSSYDKQNSKRFNQY